MGLYLAVDAGGSRTTFVLADGERVLARSEAGSIKRMRVPAEVATQHLADGLNALETQTGVALAAVTATCVGTSGASVPLVADWITQEFGSRVGGKLLLTIDVEIALDAAFQGGAGVLALAGTGSNVAARTSDGALNTAGGWGPILGDYGSGYNIGRQALRVAFRAVDRGETPTLLQHVNALWGTSSPTDILSYIYSPAEPDLAALTPLVAACAAEGDLDCASVLLKNGERLAETVLHAIARMGEATVPQVACAGSVLEHVGYMREAMTSALRRTHPDIVVLPGVVDPVMGALWQARTRS
jgi:glucosamine kinase